MKKVVQFLHGNWFGHPLHPMLVNLPMGLWPAAFAFDLASHGGGNAAPALSALAFWAILLGLAAALLAIPTGLADWSDVGRAKPAWKVGLVHLALNAVGFLVWTTNLTLRWRNGDASPTEPLPLTLSAIGTLLLLVAAYLGGRMVYDHGTYVGWMSLRKWRRVAEAGGANLPPAD